MWFRLEGSLMKKSPKPWFRLCRGVCDAVALILDTAEDLAGERTETGADAVTA